MKKLLPLALALAFAAAPASAQEPKTLMQIGEWEIMTGSNACMMLSLDLERPTAFGLIFKGEDFAFSLQNQSWNYSGTVPVKVQFAGQDLSWNGIGTGKGILIPTSDAMSIYQGFGSSYRDKTPIVVRTADGTLLSETIVDRDFMEAMQGLNQCITIFTE